MSLCVAAFTNNQRTAIKLCECDGSMLDKKKNRFEQCQHKHKIEKYSKSQIKKQFSTINNRNFAKSSRNRSNRTKVNFKKKITYLTTKNWFCVCSVTAKTFEHRNFGKNRNKIIRNFFRILTKVI
jgi:hypothetical protein